VSPAQVGFTGVRLVARLETRVRRHGVWKREVVYLVSSLSLDELQARGLLRRKRQYWIIERNLKGRVLSCGGQKGISVDAAGHSQ